MAGRSPELPALTTRYLKNHLREIAQDVIRGRVFDDLEIRHLVEVIRRCSLILSDIYSEGRIWDLLSGDSPWGIPLTPAIPPESAEEVESSLLRRLRETPDRVKAVADKCLYDVGLAGLRTYRGLSLSDLGVRSYRLASEALGQLSEDRRLLRFFRENRWANLPLQEEIIFLHQCSENFRFYAEILRQLRDVAGEGDRSPIGRTSWTLIEKSPEPVENPLSGPIDGEEPADPTPRKGGAVGFMTGQDREERIANLERMLLFSDLDVGRVRNHLKSVVIDQDSAVDEMCDELTLRAAGTYSRIRPSSFLFTGPTGVGKNYLMESLVRILEETWAVTIPWLLLEGPQFTYPSDINDLKGATRGFIRSDEEGMLSEFYDRVRQAPISVLVVDEVEKAHPQLTRFFLSILDRGTTTDNRGRILNFTHSLIVFTSNLGFTRHGGEGRPIGYHEPTLQKAHRAAVHREARRVLSPEFLNRLRTVEFRPLSRESMERIFDLELRKIQDRFQQAQGLGIEVDSRARKSLIDRGFSERYGARHLASVMESALTIPISRMLMKDRSRKRTPDSLLPRLREMREGHRAGSLEALGKQVRQFVRGHLPYQRIRVSRTPSGFRYRPVPGDVSRKGSGE